MSDNAAKVMIGVCKCDRYFPTNVGFVLARLTAYGLGNGPPTKEARAPPHSVPNAHLKYREKAVRIITVCL